ncbi:MAG TPA: (Fe-S)-binding protein [Candidatus Nanoarchaeia archaeon]|nr:(Fe-S)-binding protein [Candidatus Nanoarchaeia archaeon]
MKDALDFREMSRRDRTQLVQLTAADLTRLPEPLSSPTHDDAVTSPTCDCECRSAWALDDALALELPQPGTPEQEEALVATFLAGLHNLFSREDNPVSLPRLLSTIEHCARCQTCANACHIFEASGRQEPYRPAFRSEVLRRLYFKYMKKSAFASKWRHGDIELNWPLVARLAELSYRCNLCGRCAQSCPLGADNGLVVRELRRLFSQQLGIAPKAADVVGRTQHVSASSAAGTEVKDRISEIELDFSDRTGVEFRFRWDVEDAELLLICDSRHLVASPESLAGLGLILTMAGVSWTMSSELTDSSSLSSGACHDDAEFTELARKHVDAARKLRVKKVLIGECGSGHRALALTERGLAGHSEIPHVSALTLLRDVVMAGRIKFDPLRNDFPVTLHDPCSIVRLAGLAEPQRQIARRLCPQFREMDPLGVNNYCCGGGGGLGAIQSNSFDRWRIQVAGRKKVEQILEAFSECLAPDTPKYICAPCAQCKMQIDSLLACYGLSERHLMRCGGLAELIVNAISDVKPGFISWAR